jgi:hypothetical protein
VTNAALAGAALPVDIRHDDGQPSDTLAPRSSATLIAPFGPWSPGLRDPMERTAQFRSLAMGAAVFFGTSHPIVREFRCAETDPDAAARAFALLDSTPTLTRRRLLATFSSVTWPRGSK